MLQDVLAKLSDVRGPHSRGWYSARCPYHPDRGRPNLGLTKDGFNCLRCGAHGSIVKLAEDLGVRGKPPTVQKGRNLSKEEATQKLKERGISLRTAHHFGIRVNLEKQAWAYPVIIGGEKVVTRYKAFDSSATPKYWSHPKGKGILLYNLDGVQEEEEIWLIEGEADVWILHEEGIPSISFTGGANYVPKDAARQLALAGVKRINVCYDRDPPGREGARRVAEALGSQFQVVIRSLPEHLGEKGDITDMYQKEKEKFKEALLGLPVVEVEARKTIFKHGELVSGDLEPVDWLVEGLIPAHGLVVIGGDAGEGKSWLAEHISQCVATGEPVLGRFLTSQGPVVYVDEESHPSLLKRRLKKLAAGLEVRSDIPVTFVVGREVRIDTEDGLEDLLSVLEGENPKLVILDCLRRTHSLNENESGDAATLNAALRKIARRLGCAVVYTHHNRKGSMFNRRSGQMLRGSTDLRAGADGQIALWPTAQVSRKLVVHEKSRYSQPLEPFEIEIVDDEAGSATFVRYVGPGEAPRMRREVGEIARELIREMLDEEGQMARQDIIDRCRGQAGERAVGDALIELDAEGVLVREEGERGQHIYRLAQTADTTEEDSGLSFGP